MTHPPGTRSNTCSHGLYVGCPTCDRPSAISRAEDGTLKVTWQYVEPSEKTYLVPESHADALNDEFDMIRDRLARVEGLLSRALSVLTDDGLDGRRELVRDIRQYWQETASV